jgi:hypothetical protein
MDVNIQIPVTNHFLDDTEKSHRIMWSLCQSKGYKSLKHSERFLVLSCLLYTSILSNKLRKLGALKTFSLYQTSTKYQAISMQEKIADRYEVMDEICQTCSI